MAFLASMIRPCLCAAPGKKLVAADYSAIEGRVLAWLAGDEPILQAYRAGKRMYAVAAATIFGCTYEQVVAEKKAGNKEKDMLGKVAELACGYGGSVGAFAQMGGHKLGIDDDQARKIVYAWRDGRPGTTKLWADFNAAAIRAVERPMVPVDCGRVRFGFNGHHLKMMLPSGRMLWYRRARIGEKVWPDGKTSPQVEYFGVDQNRFGWISTYGGKLVENAVQAIARDIMMDAVLRAEKDNWPFIMRVHDELVAEVDEDGPDHAALCELMLTLPDWAKGLPIGAAGWTGKFYKKD